MMPISGNVSLFPYKILKNCLVHNLPMPNSRFNIPKDIEYDKICFGVDLALSANTDESDDADYFVIAIMAYSSKTKYYWLLNVFRERGLTYKQQIDVVKRLDERFNPDSILVESNQYQLAFAQALKEIPKLSNKVLDRKTTAKNKYNNEIGVIATQATMEQMRFKICYDENDIYTKTIVDIIMAEFNSMTINQGKIQGTQTHDDIVMACWLAQTALMTDENNVTLSFLTYY